MAAPLPPPSAFPPGYLEESHGDRVLAATSVILVLSTTLLALRLYARTLTSATRGWDEWILIPAWFFLLGLIVCLYLVVTQAGLGQHIVAVEYQGPAKVELFLKLLYTLDWFYVPANALSRVSVILLYLRIFTHKWARAACWVVLVFLVANAVQAIVSANLECFPLSFSWDKTIRGTCFNQLAWYEWTNIPNVIGDVAILLLPLRTVWGLKASTARKMGIAGVCLTGSIGLIASCVRTATFFTNSELIATDPTFADASFSWTVVESGMYFSAACLIGLRPLFSKLPKCLRNRMMHPSDHTGGVATYSSGSALRNGGQIKTPYGGAGTYHSIDGRQRDPYATLEDGRASRNAYPMGTFTHPCVVEGKLGAATSNGSKDEVPQHIVTATVVPPPVYQPPVRGTDRPGFGPGLGGGVGGRSHDNIYVETSIEVHQERGRQARR